MFGEESISGTTRLGLIQGTHIQVVQVQELNSMSGPRRICACHFRSVMYCERKHICIRGRASSPTAPFSGSPFSRFARLGRAGWVPPLARQCRPIVSGVMLLLRTLLPRQLLVARLLVSPRRRCLPLFRLFPPPAPPFPAPSLVVTVPSAVPNVAPPGEACLAWEIAWCLGGG